MLVWRQASSLQCLALGDSGLVFWWNREKRRSTLSVVKRACLRRSLSSKSKPVLLDTRKPRFPVIRDSLKETLEAQRTANRERLIRKVYYGLPDQSVSAQHSLINPEEPTQNNDGGKGDGTDYEDISKRIVKTRAFKQPRATRSSAEKQKKPSINTSFRIPWVVQQQESSPSQHPWLDIVQTSDQTNDASSFLNSEIAALAEFLSPSTTEQSFVDGILDEVSTKLRDVVPSIPRLVGSRSTRIASSNSTIDLMILANDPNEDNISRKPHHKSSTSMNPRITKSFTNVMKSIEHVMKTSDAFDNCWVIYSRSPALVMSHRASGLKIRIFCGSYIPKSDGFMRKDLTFFPSLFPLFMNLRVLLESKNMFGWEAASVDSYGLFLLISAFLRQQQQQRQQEDSSFHKQNGLGEQLLAILNTYGTEIDLSTTGVSVDPAGFFNTASIREQERQLLHQLSNDDKNDNNSKKIYPAYLVGQRALMRYKINAGNKGNLPAAKHLCIQDPTNYLNDAGLRCLRTSELQQTFAGLHRDLKAALLKWDGDGDGGSSDSILGQVLHANFDELIRRRRMMMERT